MKAYGKEWKKFRNDFVVERGRECSICGKSNPEFITVHHKIPLEMGGTHDASNLQVLCQSCHVMLHCHSILLEVSI